MFVEGYFNGKDTILRNKKKDNTIVEIPKLKFYSIEHKIEKLLRYDYNQLTWQVINDLMGIGTTTKPKLKLEVVADGEPWTDKNGVVTQELKIVSFEKILSAPIRGNQENPSF